MACAFRGYFRGPLITSPDSESLDKLPVSVPANVLVLRPSLSSYLQSAGDHVEIWLALLAEPASVMLWLEHSAWA